MNLDTTYLTLCIKEINLHERFPHREDGPYVHHPTAMRLRTIRRSVLSAEAMVDSTATNRYTQVGKA
ncbi:hypothetical protein BDP55DRAFT_15810 [Colletotrichum godetiae]|uniref:Uncharacterized protein n=1 Tax=Colletotrichum godetiae TaxID=1209918 RepID=A0AAJ0F0K1_9PEZI|nr:uncharacterized protein BDP55DRAFT_15810 [Colletotrichum godetiae]KAK1701280.1 hypothetical protein BDP55DRAFT_15810 [Colletotrichum godetiae]